MITRQKVGLILAALVLFTALLLPAPYGLSSIGVNAIGITLFFLILLITQALPLSVSCLLTIGLMPVFGVVGGFYGAVVGFAHPVIFFILASFGIAAAVTNTPIAKRVLFWLLNKVGYSIERILLAMMIASAAISFFMSNVPTCAVMMSIALGFIDLIKDAGQRRSVGKTFMIAIPVATMIGGIATPASSSLNLLAIGLLEQHTGQTISFVQWMTVGVPLVIVLIPFAWFLMLKVYKPAPIDQGQIKHYIETIRQKEPLGKKEVYVLITLAAMLVLWVASSWVYTIEIFTVAMLGCVLFFLPGIRVLSWDKFVKTINWDIIFISGTILSIAAVLVQSGVSTWMVGLFNPAQFALSTHMLVGVAALISFTMLLVITSAPALITVLAGSFIAIGIASGVPPAYLIMVLAICAGNCYLLPLDTVQLLTYSKGYYSITDMGKSTIFLQLALIVILAFWIPFIGGVLHF